MAPDHRLEFLDKNFVILEEYKTANYHLAIHQKELDIQAHPAMLQVHYQSEVVLSHGTLDPPLCVSIEVMTTALCLIH